MTARLRLDGSPFSLPTTRRRKSRGQSLVETALIMPFVAALIFGAVDLGRLVYAYNTITNAARQGARIASVNQRVTDPQQCDRELPSTMSIKRCTQEAAISLGITVNDIEVCFKAPDGSCAAAQEDYIAQVTVHYAFTAVTPILSDLLGSIDISSTSEMPIERKYP